MDNETCEWCGDPRTPGQGEWGRGQSGRYASRPGRFCGKPCKEMAWRSKAGRRSPESDAFWALRRNHPEEFHDLLRAAEQALRELAC